ncbi:two-component system response regulator CreB [Ideonella sp. BN130291]|uniref:two-component system response regulator CreB n=1 Tax=Ideonella sp. BN130291 TaxID=3112940 RepID=UPI002E25DA4F|nr:two-component system response regulator CreB [Ideonella sp. BN130291]
MAPPSLLLVEDDPAIARTVAYALEREGFTVAHAALIRDARQRLITSLYAAVILDIGLPDGSGLDLCRELRQRHAHLPLIILSARGEEMDRVLGLELGADDYLTKPFSPRELCARVRSLLRRSALAPAAAAPAPSPSALPLIEHDATDNRLRLAGMPLKLTRREHGLLLALLRRPGRVWSREQLLSEVWGDDIESTDRTVDTHVKTLRAKLRELQPDLELIVTHRGIGYSLELPAATKASP